jgi:hypothetical protein
MPERPIGSRSDPRLLRELSTRGDLRGRLERLSGRAQGTSGKTRVSARRNIGPVSRPAEAERAAPTEGTMHFLTRSGAGERNADHPRSDTSVAFKWVVREAGIGRLRLSQAAGRPDPAGASRAKWRHASSAEGALAARR